MSKRVSDILVLIGCLMAAEVAGLLSAFFISPAIPTWYAQLAKPWFTPPNAVMTGVWTVLLFVLSFAIWFVLRSKAPDERKTMAVQLYAIQLIMIVLWSIVFFAHQQIFLGLIVIGIEWFFMLGCISVYMPISKTAGWLLVMYTLWVSYAGAMNIETWRLAQPQHRDDRVACTMEAKMCPDGTYVGREAPLCEFAPCPST